MESLEIFFDVAAGVIERVDDVLLVFVVYLVQDAPPELRETLDSLHSLRLDEYEELLGKLTLRLFKLPSYPNQLADNDGFIFRLLV